jgi:hypothetical protein
MVELYPHSLKRVQRVVLNYLSTGTTSPLPLFVLNISYLTSGRHISERLEVLNIIWKISAQYLWPRLDSNQRSSKLRRHAPSFPWSVDQVNCCWPSPAPSFLIQGPAGLTTIFFCLTTLGVVQPPSLPVGRVG